MWAGAQREVIKQGPSGYYERVAYLLPSKLLILLSWRYGKISMHIKISKLLIPLY